MTVRWRVWLAVAACALVGVAVGGCAGTSGGGSAAGGASGTPAPSTPAPGTPTPSSSPVPGTPTAVPTSGSGAPGSTRPGSPGPSSVVVRGVIEMGVEGGCWVLTPDRAGPRYVLVTATTPPTGVPVTVYGTARPDQVSYCQQGTVLAVSRIERR
jgi:hypothetical protein